MFDCLFICFCQPNWLSCRLSHCSARWLLSDPLRTTRIQSQWGVEWMAALSESPGAADHAARAPRKQSWTSKMKDQREDPGRASSAFLLFWLLHFTSDTSGTTPFVCLFVCSFVCLFVWDWLIALFCTTTVRCLSCMLHRCTEKIDYICAGFLLSSLSWLV